MSGKQKARDLEEGQSSFIQKSRNTKIRMAFWLM